MRVLFMIFITLELSRSDDPTPTEPHAEQFFFNPSGTVLEAAARGVAELVSASFGSVHPTQGPPPASDFMTNIFKVLGFESSKLGAIAINAVIFLAQLIRSTLYASEEVPKDKSDADDTPPQGSPLSWIFDNVSVQARQLVNEAQASDLPEKLIQLLQFGAQEDSDCVQLLVCKSAPFVWAMQKTLGKPPDTVKWSKMSPLQRMFINFPTIDQWAVHSDTCDFRFPSCKAKYTGNFD